MQTDLIIYKMIYPNLQSCISCRFVSYISIKDKFWIIVCFVFVVLGFCLLNVRQVKPLQYILCCVHAS